MKSILWMDWVEAFSSSWTPEGQSKGWVRYPKVYLRDNSPLSQVDRSYNDDHLSLHCKRVCGCLWGEDSANVKSSRLVVRAPRLVVGLLVVRSARLVRAGVGRGEEEEGEIEQGGGEGKPGEHCGEQLKVKVLFWKWKCLFIEWNLYFESIHSILTAEVT